MLATSLNATCLMIDLSLSVRFDAQLSVGSTALLATGLGGGDLGVTCLSLLNDTPFTFVFVRPLAPCDSVYLMLTSSLPLATCLIALI